MFEAKKDISGMSRNEQAEHFDTRMAEIAQSMQN